ncbi:MAG: type II toxin-antitoxin system prevent-host-death family antitoxin [Pseudoruegeria sp.]
MKHSPIPDMKKYPAADLARNTGELLRAASVAPVSITKHKKECFVVMSTEQYEAITENISTQRAFAVADMPDDLGDLLDRGLEELLKDE